MSASPLISRTGASLLLAGFALFLSASGALGQITAIQEVAPIDLGEEDEFPWLLYGIYGFGALGTLDMKEMNEAINIMNSEIAEQGSFGVQYDRFDNSASLGVGVHGIFAGRYHLFLEFERLFGSSSVGGITAESEVTMPVNVWSGTLGYDLLSRRRVRLGIAAGVGYYSSDAEQIFSETLPNQDPTELGRIHLKGDTIGSHYGMFFETGFTDRMFISLWGGYRSVKLDELEITGLDELLEPATDNAFIAVPVAECTNCPEDGDPPEVSAYVLRGGGTSLDWSGITGRVAITVYLNIPTF